MLVNNNRMIFESEFEVLYIKSDFSVSSIELDEETFNYMNFEDFVNDLVYDLELSDFELYSGLCNAGLYGLLCSVVNGEIEEEE